jgi:hypothetical protein
MRLEKVVLVLLLISSMAMPAMAADPVQAVEQAVKNGFIDVFMSGADSLTEQNPANYSYDTGKPTSNSTPQDNYSEQIANVKNKYGPSISSIYMLSAYDHDPYQSKTVQTMRLKTVVIALFLFILYIFWGAACVNFSCAGHVGLIERAHYTYANTSFSEYKNGLIRAFIGILFIHYLFKFVILLNHGLTLTSMGSVLGAVQVTKNQWLVYFIMSIGCWLESIFIGMRILVMDLIAGCDVLLGAIAGSVVGLKFAKTVVEYFCKVTLMQCILVCFSAFGLAIVNESPDWLQVPEYIGLLIVLFGISMTIMFGFRKAFSTGRRLARGAL